MPFRDKSARVTLTAAEILKYGARIVYDRRGV
jgi:hypothetical protein